MNWILDHLIEHPSVAQFSEGRAAFSHVSLTQEALLLAAAFKRAPKTTFVVKSTLYQAQKLYAKLHVWLQEDVVLLPVEDSLRVEAIASSPEIHVVRMETLSRLVKNQPSLVITHVGAAMRHYPQPNQLRQSLMTLKVNQTLEPRALAEALLQLGYKETARVDQPSTFARRGGVVDVFVVDCDEPHRIEFFDREIESIRNFDVVTQRSVESCDRLEVVLASDLIFSETDLEHIHQRFERELTRLSQRTQAQIEALRETFERDVERMRAHLHEAHLYRYRALTPLSASVFDYAPDAMVVLSSTEDVHEQQLHIQEETLGYLVELNEANQALPVFDVYQDVFNALVGHQRIDFQRFETVSNAPRLPFRELDVPKETLWVHAQRIAKESSSKLVVCVLDEAEIKQLIPHLVELKTPYTMRLKPHQTTGVVILNEAIDEGFELFEPALIVYSAHELFHQHLQPGRFSRKFQEAESLQTYQDLQKGDYIVHYQYGVGQYLGITTKESQGIHRDYLDIVYRNNSKLYVPLEQFHLVRKFVSREGVVPKLHALGSNEWKKTKARIKDNVRDIAERLLELYQARENDIAFAFQADDLEQKEFEKRFPYPLTPDQVRAVAEIKADMQTQKPMDRLLCGDVGFGKTEVALRAAFKAVTQGKQVAFLCPTTVLSQQHHRTFVGRLDAYPINVAVLNRFVPLADQKRILEKVRKGEIDILIGTHRLLSDDVEFHDLGLLVIDEEQRFGVEHKEKIKAVKQSVHVLSLSATPIPRTLQMSLVGVRQLSQLETPPLNRHPVLTYVIEKNQAVIKEVIQRELARDGQVFYLFNNIEHINQVAMAIEAMVPKARVAVAHGQMERSAIEDVMIQFVNNEIQVLVCTTIVETGIDIPNANTILIDQADTFGLAQLYQIKGRVGRSDRLAYAYLMYQPRKQLSELAQKRLQSIKEFTVLGSGYKIAMRDLTIRGAGEMLGDLQSGFIDTVGIDMYIEMLQAAIEEKRTGIIREEETLEARPTVAVDGYIPQPFEPLDFEKLSLYQRIDQARSATTLEQLEREVEDRYGTLPQSVKLLFEKKRWELLMQAPFIDSFQDKAQDLSLRFTKAWSSQLDGVKLFEAMSKVSSELRLKYSAGQISLIIPKSDERWLSLAIEVLRISHQFDQGGETHAS
jgi:transcription-repair coupling factor (superfamily II helicase)